MSVKVESYTVSGPIDGVCKQHGVWLQEGNITYPLIYLARPKWIKCDETWKEIVGAVHLTLPHGFEIPTKGEE